MIRDTTSEFTDAELGTLDITVRNILTAATCNGHSYQDVADQFHIPVGTVKSRINRARAKIAAARVKATSLSPDFSAAEAPAVSR